MLQAISDIVKNVAIIILLTTFLDMLLPNNNLQRFIKVVMGLFVMLAILNPVVKLIDSDLELSAWQLSQPTEAKVDTVLADGKRLSSLTETQALEAYKTRIEMQMEALVKLIPEVSEVKCAVSIEPSDKIGAIGKINKTTIWINIGAKMNYPENIKPVEPVNVEIGINNKKNTGEVTQDVAEKKLHVKEKTLNVISNYYNLDKKSIDIVFY